MSVTVQRVSVAFEYPVYSTQDVFDRENPTLADALRRCEPAGSAVPPVGPERRQRAMLVIDRGVADTRPIAWRQSAVRYFEEHCVDLALELVVEGGERIKNDPRALQELLEAMHAQRLDRHSFVVIVGGGAVLDAVGYAAAIAHRGIRVVRLPTTVLSQADSGVGVKNGVNAFGKKNFLGTFAPPFAVVNDVRFLETLARRDVVAGMAEAVKVALVRDRLFFEWLRAHADALASCEFVAVAALVRRTAELHLAHIATSGDPFELGSARPLDFGHWAAHKLEAMTAHRLRHGEAVAIGIAIDALYSAASGRCADDVATSALDLLERFGLRLWDEAVETTGPDGRPVLLEGLEEFREHLGGQLTITLLSDVGLGCDVHTIDEALLVASLARLRARASRSRAA